MWIFLVTEITFFTALIGTYMLLRNGQPTVNTPWPSPHDVHLIEAIGAFNTFVLICSSLTVVLCHWYLHEARRESDRPRRQAASSKAAMCLGVTLRAWLRLPRRQGVRIQGQVRPRHPAGPNFRAEKRRARQLQVRPPRPAGNSSTSSRKGTPIRTISSAKICQGHRRQIPVGPNHARRKSTNGSSAPITTM